MTRKELELDGGTWTVEIFADHSLFIRGPHGETVHASHRHVSTAMHLAVALSKIREQQREIEDWQGFH